MSHHKDKVSAIVLSLIAALTVASILNIIQKSASYHSGFSANLIGVGFGVSLAVMVYIVMIAETAATRWTAATFAAFFAAISATIQTAMYLDEHAPLAVAIAYGAGVPACEAMLAVVEALLRKEVLAVAPPEPPAPPASHSPPTAAKETASQPPETTAKLSATQTANIRQIVKVVKSGGFATDAELAEATGWSETSARRYRQLAESCKIIYKNGDGRYHQKGDVTQWPT